MFQDKYMINIYLQGKYPHDPGGTTICQLKKYLEKLHANVNILFNNKFPPDLHVAFECFNSTVSPFQTHSYIN